MSELDSPLNERKLVPDQSDQIEVGGQKLARVRRRVVKKDEPAASSESSVETTDESAGASAGAPRPRSIDDIARKHLGPDPARVIEENSEIFRALASDAEESLDDLPPVAEIASRIELFSEGMDVVPPDEPDPKKRAGMSMSPIVGTADMPDEILFGKGAPSTLWDLFALFPQLDGANWRIHVERKTPRLFGGIPCAGMLQPITRPITQAEWAQYYGGGSYTLIVYGPPKKSGNLDALGMVQPRRLTEPITVVFPGAPSLESMVYDGEEQEDFMTQGMPGLMNRRGPATVGDAKVVEVQLEAEDKREERKIRERKDSEAREEKLRRDAEAAQGSVAQQIAAMSKQMIDMQAAFRSEQADRERFHQREIKEERQRFEEKLDALKNQRPERDPLDMLVALKGLSGGDEASAKAIEQMRKDHAREIERLLQQQKEDADRNQRLITDERARADRMIEEEKRRMEQRIKDTEERLLEREREFRARADSEIQKAKDDARQRLDDLHRQHESRIADESRNHERDLKSQAAMHQMTIDSLKASYEQRIDGKLSDIKRTETELERTRVERDANKDVVGSIQKIKEQAEALGMSEGGAAEPPSTIQTILGMLSGVVANAPSMIEQLASMSKGKSAQELEIARQQARNEMIQQSQGNLLPNPGFAPPQLPQGGRQRRDGFRPMHQGTPREPLIPGQVMHLPRTEQSPPPIRPQAQAEPDVVAIGGGAFSEAPPPYGMPPEPHLAPGSALAPIPVAPPPSIAPPPQPAVADEATLRAEDLQILQAVPLVQSYFDAGAAPEQAAAQIIAQIGPEMARNVVHNLGSSDRVVEALERSGDPGSPFLERDGKKFLRKLFAALLNA